MTQFIEKNQKNQYSVTAKVFHWGFVLLFLYGILKQVDDINQLEDISLLKFEIFFALIFIFLLLIRFYYMRNTQTSSLPTNTPKIQKIVAKTVHYGMYFFLSLIAISGLLIGFLFWLDFENNFLIEGIIIIHESSVTMIYWLIAAHIVGALYHRVLRDGVWSSMVPFSREANK